jgi:hypothetical protein
MSDRPWTIAGIDATAAAALLENLPASEVWSLLLEVMNRRAQQRSPSDLNRQWERDGFTRPSSIDQRTLNAIEGHLLAAADGFEAIELSPLAPLGCCSVIAPASQNKIVSALRGTEVVADPTNVFALECARRLREDPRQIVRLATCHRCVRAQEFPKRPGFAQHFSIFCLATSGRERQDHGLLVDSLVEHIATHRAALDRLEQHGYAFPGRRVRILATAERAALADRIAAAVQGLPVERDTLDHAYYDGLRFMINAGSTEREEIPLIDGGSFDWVGRLASNKRLTFVASGMGAQLVAHAFRARPQTGQ